MLVPNPKNSPSLSTDISPNDLSVTTFLRSDRWIYFSVAFDEYEMLHFSVVFWFSFQIKAADFHPLTSSILTGNTRFVTMVLFFNGDLVIRVLFFLIPAFTLHRRYLKTTYSLWKHIKCFPSTLHWKTKRRRNEGREVTWLSWSHRFRNTLFSTKCFLSTQKRKPCVFKFLRFEKRFRKLCFRDGFVWTWQLA